MLRIVVGGCSSSQWLARSKMLVVHAAWTFLPSLVAVPVVELLSDGNVAVQLASAGAGH